MGEKDPPPDEKHGFLRLGGAPRGPLKGETSADQASLFSTETRMDPALDAIPAQLGPYRIVGRLGAGGMGDVLLAFDDRLKRHVAIKRVLPDARMDPRARERLRREAAAVAALDHPAVVRIHDILEGPWGEAIVMEHVEGRTLAELLRPGPLPAQQVVSIGRQVAEGLAAAHAVGLIHRDLKTQNVKATPSGQIKILDFGLAKRLTHSPSEDSLTADGALVGTRRAMSPEQARGQALDARSDLFSLGVLLYEIATGRSPFESGSPEQTLRNVIGEAAPDVGATRPDLPAPFVAVIGELLAKDPARRPATAADVATRLKRIEESFRPNRRPLVIAAVAALVLSIVVVGALLRRASTASQSVAVLVQMPEIASPPPDERSQLAAFAVREAILHTLAGLEHVEPVGPDEVPERARSPQDAARAAAATEIVIPTISCQSPWCRVALRRLRAADARIIASSGSFDVPSDSEDSLELLRAVELQVRRVFSDHGQRPSRGPLEVEAGDYLRYLAVKRRADAGEVLGRQEVDDLEGIARSSPGLTEASILAAGAARRQRDRVRAERVLEAAESRHGDDARVAYERFLLELETGQLADAKAALAELEARAPGDVRVWRARGRLYSQEGRFEEAREALGRLARERPSWRNLWDLADVEIQMADAKGARLHLAQLLQASPGNARGLAKLAELEWLMGDPAKAAGVYEGLLKEKVTRQNLTNLGWSRLLAREYALSADAYRRALELEPEHLNSRMNLGIVSEGARDVEGARRLYRDVLERTRDRERKGPLTVSERLIQAQALARLGDSESAVALTIQALGEGNRTPQVIFQAALIYAICGDRTNAIVYAKEARKRLSPWWFGLPGFESLRATPAFRELLAPA